MIRSLMFPSRKPLFICRASPPRLCFWWSCCPGADTLFVGPPCKNYPYGWVWPAFGCCWPRNGKVMQLGLGYFWSVATKGIWYCVFTHGPRLPTVLGVFSDPWTICALCLSPEAAMTFSTRGALVAFACFLSFWWAQCVAMLLVVLIPFPVYQL